MRAATPPINAGEELIRIPRAAILDGVAADESAVAGLWRDSATPPPGYAKLALAILYELRLGSASRYAPYLNLLPSMEAFASGGGPAATWSDEELAVTECGKLIAQASSLRELRRNGGGHAALEPSKLQARWVELNLPGSPPNEEELAWAVTAVTSALIRWRADRKAAVRMAHVSGMITMAWHLPRLSSHQLTVPCAHYTLQCPHPNSDTRPLLRARARVCTLLMPLVQVDMANHNGPAA